MLQEIDTRPIEGNGGVVVLSEHLGGPERPFFVVDVFDVRGELVATIGSEDRGEALETYKHPFARPDVPDVFRR